MSAGPCLGIAAVLMHAGLLFWRLASQEPKGSRFGLALLWFVSAAVPMLTVVIGCCMVANSSPVLQGAVGDPDAMTSWRYWVGIWPMLLALNLMWLVGHCCAFISLLIDRAPGRSLAFATSGSFLCTMVLLSLLMSGPRA